LRRRVFLVCFSLIALTPISSFAFQPDFQDASVEDLFLLARGGEGLLYGGVAPTASSSTLQKDKRAVRGKPATAGDGVVAPSHWLPANIELENLMERLSRDPGRKEGPTSSRKSPQGSSSSLREENPEIIARILRSNKVLGSKNAPVPFKLPNVRAKALLCIDHSSNEVLLERNSSEPLPIASITKLVTAMTVIDEMNLDSIVEVPRDIRKVEKHVVGIRPGDLLTVRDLLHGLLIESGNDCAEVLARAYPHGGHTGFIMAMNKRVKDIGATHAVLYTPSGLDLKKDNEDGSGPGDSSGAKIFNTASARDVALIAWKAFSYPLIRKIATMKTHTLSTRNDRPRVYRLVSNDKLLDRGLPLAGAKTGYTDLAGRCIVASFRDRGVERTVVVLNSPRHFQVAEKIYRWAAENN